MVIKNFRRKNAIGHTAGDLLFLAVNFLLLTLFLLIILYPLLYVVASSFSGGSMFGNSLSLIPSQWTLEGYRAILEDGRVLVGYRNSIVYMTLGTLTAMLTTVLCAYPLSRRDFKGGKYMMALCVFTMYFSGGLIPTYLWIKNLGLLDRMWALILPASLSVYNMIVMRTYFRTQIPDEMLEASQIDGCGNWRFLSAIVLPLSGPILAVIALYYAVAEWNSYFNALLYISSENKLPLASVLREILIVNMSATLTSAIDADSQALLEKRAEIMKYSLICVASLPMMILYPFVQKYFVKGVMIGAVKG